MATLYFEHTLIGPFLDDAKREMFVSRLPLARAARIRAPRLPLRRAERAAAEVAFRRACQRAGEDYASLTVAYTDTGKPYLEGRPDLAISISHTPYLAAVALVKAEPGDHAPAVGLDITAAGRAPARAGEIAERFFSPAERTALQEEDGSLPDTASDRFLATWCRMEARVKMTGEGIGCGDTAEEPPYRRSFVLSPEGTLRHFVAIACASALEE